MSHLDSPIRSYPRGVALLALSLSVMAPAYAAQTPGKAPVVTNWGDTKVAPRPDRKVDLDFVNADVNVVAKALSIQSGENVVLMPSVRGTVTVRLRGLSLEESLRKVAAAVGSDVQKHGSVYFLGSTIELRALMNRTGEKVMWAPKYIPPSDAKELIQASFPYLTVETIGKTTLMVLSGMPDDIQAAIRLAEGVDTPRSELAGGGNGKTPDGDRPKPAVQVKDFYTAKYAKAQNLAEMLSKAMPELRISSVDRTVVVEGTADQYAQASKLLAALDVQGTGDRVVRAYSVKYLHPNQAASTLKPFFPNLVISSGFESYSPDPAEFKPLSQDAQKAFRDSQMSQDPSQMATTGAAGAGGPINGPGARSRTIILAGPADEVDQATRVLSTMDIAPQQVLIEARMVDITPETLKELGFKYEWSTLNFFEKGKGERPDHSFAGSFARSPFDFSVEFDAKITQGNGKILARPNVAVIDGEDASIFIGDIVRFERLSSVSDTGQQIFTIESIPIGVALLARPRVNADGNITMRIHPVVSTVSGFTGQRRDLPTTSSREADTTIMMKDGETIAIGGLLREDDIKTLTKIPLLGDIPVLGQLFRHREHNKRKSEVTIFITAKILKT